MNIGFVPTPMLHLAHSSSNFTPISSRRCAHANVDSRKRTTFHKVTSFTSGCDSRFFVKRDLFAAAWKSYKKAMKLNDLESAKFFYSQLQLTNPTIDGSPTNGHGIVSSDFSSEQEEAAKQFMDRWRDQSELFESMVSSLRGESIEDLFVFATGAPRWKEFEPEFVQYLEEKSEFADGTELRQQLQFMCRGLKSATEDIDRCEQLLAEFNGLRASDWEDFVSKNLDNLNERFFVFLLCRMEGASVVENEGQQQEDKSLSELEMAYTTLLDLREAVVGDVKETSSEYQEKSENREVSRRLDTLLKGDDQADDEDEDEEDEEEEEERGKTQIADKSSLKDKKTPSNQDEDHNGFDEVRVMDPSSSKKQKHQAELPPELQMVQYLLEVTSKPMEVQESLRDFFLPPEMPSMRQNPALDDLRTTPEDLLDTIDVLLTSANMRKNEPSVKRVLDNSPLVDSLVDLRKEVFKWCDFKQDMQLGDESVFVDELFPNIKEKKQRAERPQSRRPSQGAPEANVIDMDTLMGYKLPQNSDR